MDCGTVGQTVGTWLWPKACAHCREDLSADAASPLCLACRLKLLPVEPPFCGRCCEPLARGAHCRRCERRPFSCSPVRAAFRYEASAVSMVHAFKYNGRRSAARAAGEWMASAFARFPELGRVDAVVPVPLHPARRRQRGYNQAALIAEAFAARLDLPVVDQLRRMRETPPQWSLDRKAREENVRGAFCVLKASEIKGLNALLVDDVFTSGASLEACAEALLNAGAARVCGYVFARQANLLREAT